MAAPAVSVIVPLHDNAPYILAAIDSAIRQTHPPHEILVVENGSSDDGPDRVAEFARSEDRVRLLRHTRPNASEARNLGIEQARSEWIAPLDADDEWMPEKLERQLAFLARTETATGRRVASVGCWAVHVGVTGRSVGISNLGLSTIEEFDQKWSAGEILYAVNGASLYRRQDILEVGGYRPDYVPADDVELNSRLGALGAILNVPEPLFRYRIHDGSESTSRFIGQQIQLLRLEENIRRRRRGERELTYGEMQDRLEADAWWARGGRWRKWSGRRHYRIAGGALAAGQIVRGLGHLGVAAAYTPEVVVQRLGQQVVPFLVRRVARR